MRWEHADAAAHESRTLITPQLIPHGERIRIEYAPLPGESEGAAGRSTDADRQNGQDPGLVTRYSKTAGATYQAIALGWIKDVYQDAIEYTSVTKDLKGMAFVWGIFFGLGIAPVLVGGGAYMMGMGSLTDLFPLILGGLMFLGSLAFGLYMLAFMLRMDLFRPSDLPIIFDRKNRKVYRLMREEISGFKGAFMPWAILACEYEWDLIDAEHHSEVFTTGGGVNTNHFFMFLVRKSKDDPTIIDSFQIAHANVLSNEITDGMWEHIRRFMEEDGPHLPSPSEPLADMEPPTSWWESMGAVGPFGANYAKFWRESPVYTLFMHLIFPASFPMFLLWGTGNYLSYRTAIPVQWPKEVLSAIGPSKRY
jgi:hypothetical protein